MADPDGVHDVQGARLTNGPAKRAKLSIGGADHEPLFSDEDDEIEEPGTASAQSRRKHEPAPVLQFLQTQGSHQMQAELADAGVGTILPLVARFAEGLLPLVTRCARGEPVAPFLRGVDTRQPSVFELDLLLLGQPSFMPRPLAGNINMHTDWIRSEMCFGPGKVWEHCQRFGMRPVHVEQEMRHTVLAHVLPSSTAVWVPNIFWAWAALQTDLLDRGGVGTPTPNLAPHEPKQRSDRAAFARAKQAFTDNGVIAWQCKRLLKSDRKGCTDVRPAMCAWFTAGSADHGAVCAINDGACAGAAADRNTGRRVAIHVCGLDEHTPVHPKTLLRSRVEEQYFNLLVQWRYLGFYACLAGHKEHAVDPRKLFYGEGEKRLLQGELKRRGLNASFKTVTLKAAPVHCLNRPSPYPYPGQYVPTGKEALKQKYQLLKISWSAALEPIATNGGTECGGDPDYNPAYGF
jgi:hypothetical protein